MPRSELTHLLRVERVTDGEIEIAFGVLKDVAQWIKSQGRRQRITNTSMATYLDWQKSKYNYAVRVGGEFAGVFSMPLESFTDWPDYLPWGQRIWLRALATHPRFRGHGVGAFAVKSALKIAGKGNPVFLDCVSGFLPDYYASLGFDTLANQRREYPGEGFYNITLLQHPND